jgi:hypothetical protein
MEAQSNPRIVFKFRRPSGSSTRKASPAMTAALRRLSQADEMQPLLKKARATGRDVVIEVFHTQDGQPLLIHPTLKPLVNR